jgi:hypothetical protein
MNNQRAIIGLVAFLAVLAVPLFALAAPNTNQRSPLSVSLDGSNPAGDYVVYVLKDDVWKEVGRLSFDKFFRQKELDLSKYVSDDSDVKVRLVQKGGEGLQERLRRNRCLSEKHRSRLSFQGIR